MITAANAAANLADSVAAVLSNSVTSRRHSATSGTTSLIFALSFFNSALAFNVRIRPRCDAPTTSHDPLPPPTPTLNVIRDREICALSSLFIIFQDLEPATVEIARYHHDLRNPEDSKILPLFQQACAFCNKDIQGEILSRLRLTQSIQGEILSLLRPSLSFDQEISLGLLAHPPANPDRLERGLFIGTRFSNLYTAVDTPARGRVVVCLVFVCLVFVCKYV
jgi:hypothetical protein